MSRVVELFKTLLRNRIARWVGVPLVLAAGAASLISQSQSTPPLVNLSAEPLYARGARAKPTLTLALSVEFPTVGAQYVSTPNAISDNTYAPTTEYIGYFHSDSCYTYSSTDGYFSRSGAAVNRTCSNAFSGNFMNWATSSAIDILRFGLTGGDRAIDTDSLTVLQRAVLPNTGVSGGFWNGVYFPDKILTAALAPGAVPNSVASGSDLHIANCLNQVHFGSATAANAGGCNAAALTAVGTNSNRGMFYTRVRVCESGDPRTGLCLRYPNGNYKPVGNLQKSADNIRVAAFGYLNHSDVNRYGGVLRAPMKYVGPRSYDANFALSQTANAVQEWDASTGVFLRNPDATILPGSTPNSGANSNWPNQQMSGVINYLNQFGRTGIFGQYKGNDPVSELYYESLRYLQGLPPTSGTTIGTSPTYNIDNTMRDGFPVYTSWLTTAVPDPHPAVSGMTDYSCIKNNIVAIGDVNTHADAYIPGNPRTGTYDIARGASVANNEPNFYNWTHVVGAFEEADTSQSYLDGVGAGTNRYISNFNPANLYNPNIEDTSPGTCCDENTYYMAGIAYWANTHDIRGTGWTGNVGAQRPGMRVKTYILDVNEAGRQSDTATRRRSQFYLAGKYGGFDDDARSGRPGVGNPFIALAASSPASGTPIYVNDNSSWQRVSADAAKREAKSYFLSSSAAEVLAALDQIFIEINAQARSIAGGAISTQRLTTNTGYIYQAQFDPTDWSGDLLPVAIAASGNTVSVGNENTSPWRNAANVPVGAAGVLDDRNIASSPRSIYVGYSTSASTPSFNSAPFRASAIPTVVSTALQYSGNPASAGQTDTRGPDRLEYLRGDRSNEAPAGVFRRRGSRLGDIVNSGVVYAGAPSANFPGTTYATFRTTYASRARALYVGANDGMLHAFNADTGAELFAYIPSWVVPNLSSLTHPSYIHRSYQDATPAVAEVDIDPSTAESWRTVLVSGSGAGGQGVFALNVTDPASWAYQGTGATTEPGNSNVMWEFSDRDDPAMGNVIGRPQLLKLNVGTATSPSYRWYAVVASGVNNNAADGSAGTGAPALFFLALDKAKTAAWSEGTGAGNTYFKVVFPQADNSIADGMVGFSVRLGIAGEVNYIYGGDLQGNLWKLDVSAIGGTTASANAYSYFKNASNAAVPMYTAFDSTGIRRQPITMEPSLAFAANRNIIVSFGTGKFLETTDNAGPYRQQSVYALLDNNTTTLDTTTGGTVAISGRGRLRAPESVSATAVDFNPFIWGRATSDTDTDRLATTVRSGWYFDYYQSGTTGERQVSNFAILSGKLIFGSVIPAPDTCSNGDGNLYVIDLQYGDGTTTASTVGILGEPFLVQVGVTMPRPSDTTGRRREQTRYQIILQGSAGSAAPPTLGIDDVTWPGRLSWREISNYQELRNTP